MPCHDPQLLDCLRLANIPGVSSRAQRALVAALGDARSVLCAERDALRPAVGASVAEACLRGPDERSLARALAWLDAPAHHAIAWTSSDYPSSLREIADPPLVLYVRGRIELLKARCIAIVGSRNCTPQGARDAHEFARALSAQGLTIVSGLALGVDSAAHRGGMLERGSTIAVMGTGPEKIYPPRNDALGSEIAVKGCLLTEFAPGMNALAGNFPRRNRLISGLAQGVLVIEAARKSGSLITAREAAEQGRDVFAMPGSIHSPMSKGCHDLIRDGAKLVETAEDVLSDLGWLSGPRAPQHHGEPEEQFVASPLLNAMGHGPMSVDQLCAHTGLTAATVASALSRMQVEGRVDALPGGWFQRAPGRS